MVGVREVINTATGKKDLLVALQRIYENKPPSNEVYVITLAADSKKNFLDFLELKTLEEISK